MTKVTFKQNVLDIGKSLLGGGGLGDNVDAVGVFLDHLVEATNLPFNDFETAEQGFFVLVFHILNIIPPRGYTVNISRAYLIFMRIAIATAFAVLSLVALTDTVDAQMMGGGYTVTDDGHTAQEEAEGKVIVQNLANGNVTCAVLTEEDFERVGEYYMGLMVGDAHVPMNAMMERQLGESGEEQMHVIMGKRLSECDPTAGDTNAAWGSSWFPMMSMMNGISGGSWSAGMMNGYNAAGWNTLAVMTMGLFWVVGVLALIALIRALITSKK